MKRRSVLAGLALATACDASRASLAQSFPSRPIRLVVGYSPGGGNDLIARWKAVAHAANIKLD